MRGYNFVGVIKNHDPKTNTLEVMGRNYFKKGDMLEIIDPEYFKCQKMKVKNIYNSQGDKIDKAHNGYHVFIETDKLNLITPYSLLRRKQ